ncbi:peptidylprolyl isomerase [Sphingosinicella sp.]|uniref:peptidylprolyl isomerase n=1 Tax=Sphingosinicella sp. TaxID=1917971 RepID=UPI004037792B
MFRSLLLFVAMCVGSAAVAQTPPVPPAPATVRVLMRTSAGDITMAIETRRAPITAANFLRYVDARRLDGTEFYRAMPGNAPGTGLIQGGVRDPRILYPPIAHEPTSRTGLTHVDGALSVPRLGVGTARGDFTIMVGDQHYLDAGPGSAGDGQGYAVFGRVVEGMDVVRRILASPTSPTEGQGIMRGQMLSPRIRVITARRVPAAR